MENRSSELNELQKCQKEKKLESCYSCKEWANCEIREKYVRVTYKKLSKDNRGSFDF